MRLAHGLALFGFPSLLALALISAWLDVLFYRQSATAADVAAYAAFTVFFLVYFALAFWWWTATDDAPQWVRIATVTMQALMAGVVALVVYVVVTHPGF